MLCPARGAAHGLTPRRPTCGVRAGRARITRADRFVVAHPPIPFLCFRPAFAFFEPLSQLREVATS